jgi:acyl carrier protein phosphodiesterase
MNYLAHAYLSFGYPELLVGNMISDFVKGKKKFSYSAAIQQGIMLHRAIDEFTDTHEVTKDAKKYFKNDYRLYAGAFIDIVYDHFLAKDSNEFPQGALKVFSQKTYGQLQSFEPVFPERFERMFYFMQTQDWLYHYQFPESIKNSFNGLTRRAKYMDDYKTAFQIFETYYAQLQECYTIFFPSLKAFALTRCIELQK